MCEKTILQSMKKGTNTKGKPRRRENHAEGKTMQKEKLCRRETHTERKTCAEEKPMQKRKTMQKENPCRLILRKKFFIGANH